MRWRRALFWPLRALVSGAILLLAGAGAALMAAADALVPLQTRLRGVPR